MRYGIVFVERCSQVPIGAGIIFGILAEMRVSLTWKPGSRIVMVLNVGLESGARSKSRRSGGSRLAVIIVCHYRGPGLVRIEPTRRIAIGNGRWNSRRR